MGREKALSPLCMTRWGERLHAWSRFSDVYQVVIITLEVIIGLTNFPESQETFDPSTKSKARILINSLTSSEFIVAQESLKVIMSKLEATTKALQGPTENILSAYQSINALINLYADMRSDVDDLFDNIWKECQSKATAVGAGELKAPRCSKNQTMRSNPTTSSAKEHYRVTVAIPLISGVHTELVSRFSTSNAVAIQVSIFDFIS